MPKARKPKPDVGGGVRNPSTVTNSIRGIESLAIIWPAVKSFCGGCYSLTSSTLWLLVGLAVLAIVFDGLTRHATVIEPISVPKALADSGYTPDVADRRLSDAITQFVNAANAQLAATTSTGDTQPTPTTATTDTPDTADTQLTVLGIALHGDAPNIVVPGVGLSLDAIVLAIRTLLRSTRSKSIAGEFTIKDKLLWLHLRIDGNELYVSPSGVDPERPDDLLTAAVPKILEVIQPYFFAVAQHKKDPANALEMVNEIIGRLPDMDSNLAPLYNLKGNIYRERHDDAEAIKAYNKALNLNSNLSVAYLNRGNVFKDQGKRDEAVAEYRSAISANPNYAPAHNNLGL